MKGITPVIAIILLLLMAVAAAGGFYFVYQGFTESGEESGATQIESLGEQSLAQIQIESAAGGRIYVKNVGAGEIDLSKSTVYVESVPVEVNRSSDTLAERSRAVLKFTQRPNCASDRCEVEISGAASASRTIELSKLVCSSNTDCYAGEACEGGVCVEEGEEEAVCGDGECDEGENGMSCFEDCGPRSVAVYNMDFSGGDYDVYSYDWDGTTYAFSRNLTPEIPGHDFIALNQAYDSEGNSIVLGLTNTYTSNSEIMWSLHNGTDWSPFDNLTDNEWNDQYNSMNGVYGMDFNSSDEAIAVWETGEPSGGNMAWASFDGTGWSEPVNLTNTPENFGFSDFSFAPDDTGIVLFESYVNYDSWINYSVWDGGWGEAGTVTETYWAPDVFPVFRSLSLEFNDTHGMAVWTINDFEGIEDQDLLQWATWDEVGWTEPQNVSGELSRYMGVGLEVDANGEWLLVVSNATSEPPWPEWYSWEDGWVLEGNLTENDPTGVLVLDKNENDAITGKLLNQGPGGSSYVFSFTYWDGTGWSEPVAFSA